MNNSLLDNFFCILLRDKAVMQINEIIVKASSKSTELDPLLRLNWHHIIKWHQQASSNRIVPHLTIIKSSRTRKVEAEDSKNARRKTTFSSRDIMKRKGWNEEGKINEMNQ